MPEAVREGRLRESSLRPPVCRKRRVEEGYSESDGFETVSLEEYAAKAGLRLDCRMYDPCLQISRVTH